jgi:hypothetical protein
LKSEVSKGCFSEGLTGEREKLILLIILKRIFVEIVEVGIGEGVDSDSEVAFGRIGWWK